MSYIVDSAQMKALEQTTIEKHFVPSLILMEKAASGVFDVILDKFAKNTRVGVIAGCGNNGADGVAVARMLHLAGFQVLVHVSGNPDNYSDQLQTQIAIAKSYGVPFVADYSKLSDCSLFVDALFGTGLNRPLSIEYTAAIDFINESTAKVISVDIPSGFSADSGKNMGAGVKADITVTFAYQKTGHLLGECYLNCGEIIVKDIGVYFDALTDAPKYELIDESILRSLPKRQKNANKGSCGKVLVIAGSESIYGACYLSAKAALTAGSGLVKVYTHVNNISSIQQALPEAMYLGYDSYNEAELIENLHWADVVLIGPGLGTSALSARILAVAFKHRTGPLVVDADGLNLLAKRMELLSEENAIRGPIVLTPHLKEMERLSGIKVSDINDNMLSFASDFVANYPVILVLKNYTTLVQSKDSKVSFIASGNEALATAGSGDVLAGTIASFLGQISDSLNATLCAAYTHGAAGSFASRRTGIRGLLASDIIAEFGQIIK